MNVNMRQATDCSQHTETETYHDIHVVKRWLTTEHVPYTILHRPKTAKYGTIVV